MSADTRTEDKHGSEPMICVAAARDAVRALKALLASGASIDLAMKNGDTALVAATQYGNLSCLQVLLDAGANANKRNWLGNTPLMHAVTHKQVECARALLPATDLAVLNRAGRTAFHDAVLSASEACFELLLPLVSDVDMRTVAGVDPDGQAVSVFNETALHLACEKGHLQTCKALLSRGADRMARDTRQKTPLHYAAAKGHLSCVIMLVGRPGKVRMTPAEVNASDEFGLSALHYTAGYGLDQTAPCSSGRARDWMRRHQAAPLRSWLPCFTTPPMRRCSRCSPATAQCSYPACCAITVV